MKSLSRALISLTLLISVLPTANAQRRHQSRHSEPAPKPVIVAVAKPTPAPPKPVATQPTPAPVAQPTPIPSPVAVATPAPTAKTDIESRPVSSYTTPATALPVPTATIQDMVIKLVGVVALMLMGALGWRKLRRPGLPKSKVSMPERPEVRLLVTEQMNLNPQQMLYVVRYADRMLLVGSSPQNLNLITDLTPGAHALPAMASAALPAPVTEAIRELSATSEPVARTPRPAPEDRFAGIFDRLRAQEGHSAPEQGEYRVPRGEVRTIAELEEDQEELALAAAGRRSLFGNTASNGGTRWSGR